MKNIKRLPITLVAVSLAWVSLNGFVNAAPAGHAHADSAVQDAELVEEIEQWRKRRLEGLLRPDGWTAVIGLHWLEPGRHSLGSAADSDLRLGIGPARIGIIEEKGGRALFIPEPGVPLLVDGEVPSGPVELKRYSQGTPATTVRYDEGKGSITLILSGKRRALRVYHADAPTRLNFAGIDYWPIDAGWRIKGKFVPHQPARVVPVVDVLGGLNDQVNPGVVVFERDGRTFSLEVIGDPSRGLSLMFADRTNGKGSYPSGRFLYTSAPDANGEVVVDFNKTYTPPCAYTEFGTCLLPPPENRLDLAVTAGEKTYSKPAGHL